MTSKSINTCFQLKTSPTCRFGNNNCRAMHILFNETIRPLDHDRGGGLGKSGKRWKTQKKEGGAWTGWVVMCKALIP